MEVARFDEQMGGEIRLRWRGIIKARSAAVWRLADLLLRRPVVNARVVAEELDLDVGNVHRYVKPLLEAGILAQSLDVKRNQVWRAPEVLAALDAFTARAGRLVTARWHGVQSRRAARGRPAR